MSDPRATCLATVLWVRYSLTLSVVKVGGAKSSCNPHRATMRRQRSDVTGAQLQFLARGRGSINAVTMAHLKASCAPNLGQSKGV